MKTPKKELKALLDLAKECLEKPNSEVCQAYKDKILDACPSLKVEKNTVEKGFWYVSDVLDKWLIYYESNDRIYGFNIYGDWYENPLGNDFNKDRHNIKKADPDKVEELLIAEAKKRGFKKGITIKQSGINKSFDITDPIDGGFILIECRNILDSNGNGHVFEKGKWAEIIETISLSEAEKIIGKKIKID